MAEADDGAARLIGALERCGLDRAAARQAAEDLRRNEVAAICWNEDDRDAIVLHAFELARVRALLEQAAQSSPDADARDAIAQSLRGIDEHVRLNRWPAHVAEEDPALLAALWRRHRRELADALADGDAGRIARLKAQGDHWLRMLLRPPPAITPAGTVGPIEDWELGAGLIGAAGRHARAVAEEALRARQPTARGFLCAVYGCRRISRLNRLIDLQRIDSGGFSGSLVQTQAGLAALTENLSAAREALGPERFARITAAWGSLDAMRLIAVLDLHPPGIMLGGYRLAYPVEHAQAQMPPWMESSSTGELRPEPSGDAGVYILLADRGQAGSFDAAARERLHAQYLDFQNDLIRPNYDALQLIVAHSDVMTRLTAQTILALLRRMVEAYRRIAPRADGEAALGRYEAVVAELDRSWRDLSQSDELPADLRHRITSIGEASPGDGDTAHALIRFLHERGNRALERLMTAARADLTVTVGRIGGDAAESFQIARLDDAPIVVRGVVRQRAVAAIVRAARWLAVPIPGTFVLVRNHVSYSVRLGEHRAELSANIDAPDREGFIRLQSYQGGVELAQQLRGAFIRKVLAEAGLAVTCDQDGLVDALVVGVLNKDHGARSDAQIEAALVVVLRLLWSLRDLDYAMAYLFAQEPVEAGAGATPSERINEFAASLARIFLVEGRIPFAYRGDGMPFDAYCAYTGPGMHREYRAYLAEERQMARYRLFFTLNALLQKFDLPAIPPGTGGVGQDVIDRYFNLPLRDALGRGELRLDARGRPERNPDYQPLKQITREVVAREDEALRIAVLLTKSDLDPAYRVIGSIDRLTVLGAQKELAPNAWLAIYGLADDENRTVLYAFAEYGAPRGGERWLSPGELRRCLRKAGYRVADKIQIPAFRKLVSHRLLVERPRARSRIMGSSVRGLLASVGDGSVRIGRVTFDRAFFADPRTCGGRVLLVPFTTPEDIEAIRAAEAVLVTSGGLLSHAGVTTREFAIPSLILPHAEWLHSPDGLAVRLEERHPGTTQKTEEGFWVSDSVVSETVTVREGDVVLVWPSQGVVSIIPMSGPMLEQAHELMLGIASGSRRAADAGRWLEDLAAAADAEPALADALADALAFILAEALWDKRIDPDARRQLIDVVHRARIGMRPDGQGLRLPERCAAYVEALVRTVPENAFAELELLLSEVERSIAAIAVYWRAINILAVVERLWRQVTALADSLALSDGRIKVFERRIDRLRHHPRIALLRTSALHEVESFARRNLTEAELPAIRKALRRLGHGPGRFRPQRLLLVCTANVDRSPMAEMLLKRMLSEQGIGGIEVRSCGVAAIEDRPMSEISQALLLAEDGISAVAHRSRRVDEAHVGEADLILAMEHAHVKRLAESYPEARQRIFLLSGYGRAPEIGDIEDPAGQVGEAYPRMKRALEVALAGALRRMGEEGVLARGMTAYLQARAEELTHAKRARIAGCGRSVVPLEEVDADSVELVGGKGANLGEIAQIVKRHGAQVPPALMVTTHAFERFLDENGIREALARMTADIDALHLEHGLSDEDLREQIVEGSDAIRDLIAQGTLDAGAGVGREIMEEVESYGLNGSCLSVRSSGLQEDTEEAAFAGAAETYLCVSPFELLDWIKTVWRSFWLTRGILYRSSRIVRQGPVKPAVIVQQMFESQVSGVMFTTDPVSGRDVIVVEAGYGLGEGVVSGLVDVDRYYVDKFDGSVTGIHVGKKSFMVTQHPSGKGTSIVPVDSELRDAPCLTERDIRANIALALEEHYALSQDIEFAIADGRFCVLQTRPITTR